MKGKIRTIIAMMVFTWLLLSFGGCERPCYDCAVLEVAVNCIKGNDTISTYAEGTVSANETIDSYQSQGYKCDTIELNYYGGGCTGCYHGCGKKYLEQMAQAGAICTEQR